MQPFRVGLSAVWAGVILALASAIPVRGAEPAASCEAAARLAASEQAVPADLLLAIALAESGRTSGGALRPWPWAVNQGGQGYWFATRDEAETHVAAALDAGVRNIDLGCFQINHRWHGARFPSVAAMFDPVGNARYAARFLADLYEETGDWSAAAGAYHSRTPDLAARYLGRVEALRRTMAAAPPLPEPPQRVTNRYPLLQDGAAVGAGSLVRDVATGRPALIRTMPRSLFGG
jgi:soluble lytic murein transglycosylase-like protein